MGTDFSRVRLDALLDYAGVELKQGAVLLDGDANEAMDIVDRRLRALGVDLHGPVLVSATTPDAFEIKASGGTLTIGVGRLYVDGLLAQCHGGDRKVAADRAFDTILGESTYKNPLPYADQPYLHALAPPVLPATGRHLVYLDVWNREVTHLEQPDLVEIAVGVETSSRIQTVWQVKVLETGSDATCASPDKDLPGWAGIIAPSTGVLTTGIDPVAPVDDPCELPPTGGYRGLENQLYRVEIHDPTGAAGGPTFKWSRDNASVGSRVVSIVSSSAVNGTVLELETLGRDDVLSFKSNDWVEIIADSREFASRPGAIGKIAVDAAHRRITVKPELPADLQPALPAELNLRVRRWDGTSGVIAIPSPPAVLTLEHGVTVRLDPGTKGFRTGDHWVFAARTADASVEKLDAAPPRGIQHHYARLAIWDADAGTVTDCRPKRPAGCCTFVVRPGESIQDAIDALPPAGGCVCLKAGLHLIHSPIIIARDNVTLHGESMGAIVRGPGVVLVVGGNGDFRAQEVRISSIVFQQARGEQGPIVLLMQAQRVVIHDCRLEIDPDMFGFGLMATESQDIEISRSVFERAVIGAWFFQGCRDVTVSGCDFRLSADSEFPIGLAIFAQTMSGPIVAEDNIVSTRFYGIIVDDDPNQSPVSAARGSRICGNRITLIGTPRLPERAFAIDVAAEASIVVDNHIEHRGGNLAGIRLCGNGSSARGNVIKSVAVRPASTMLSEPSIAIVAGNERDEQFLPLERLVIADNIIEGIQHGIALAGVARSRVSGNILGGSLAENGILANRATDCILTENVLSAYAFGFLVIGGARNTLSESSMEGGGWGVAFANEEAPTISGNRLRYLNQAGILIWGAIQRCNVIENRIISCGSAANIAIGVNALSIQGELHVEGNEVSDLGVSRLPNGPKAPLAYGINGEDIYEARIENNIVTYSSPTLLAIWSEHRALRMRGFRDEAPTQTNKFFGASFAVQITNNKFIGPGASALVELLQTQISNDVFGRFERVLFHGNYCAHFTPPRDDAVATSAVTVSLVGRRCSITGNHVKTLRSRLPSYNLHNMPGPFIGNVSQGFSGRTTQMPNPESSFNTNT